MFVPIPIRMWENAEDDPLFKKRKSNMKVPVSGSGAVGKAMCEALGLDVKKVYSIHLKVEADEVVTVTVEQYVHEDEMKEVTKILTKYELHEKG